ncbi:uncharacterized protein K02A2.6-like [Helicoverpa armigera]|uniref:uncharacterized protein K02A2.6-like n=1 Tax=Helicoverpa armigera TaxID=29058 RepID=UPI00308329C6
MCLDYQVTFPDLYPACVASESKQTPSSVTEAEPMDIGIVKSNECRRCVRAHRPGERCPFVKAKCFYCKKFGHIAAACSKKPGREHQVDDIREANASNTSIEKMMGVYVCVENYSPPITTDVMIDGVQISMEVDSANKEAQCELVVVSGNGPNLLGRNWFHALGLQVSGLCWTEEEIEPYRRDFPELFREGLGEYKGPEVKLHVRREATPRFLKARVVPYPLKEKVIRQLNEMVKAGVLTPVRYSEWATPITPVIKQDTTIRICGDYRATVNAAIDTDIYPLPTSVEAFVRLSGGRIFSKLDLKNAYTQLKVDDETAMMLTLNTPIGLMKVNRLPFGVSAAPAIFQRLMSTALAGMDGVACLLDDIAVTGATMDEHNWRLREVLNKLQQMGLRLNVRKCVFAANSITFLGHMIDAEGLHPAPAKVKEIQEKSAPTNRETLRAFLGLYNFYEKFLPDKSTVLEPLYRLLESKRPWRWGEKEQEAFVEAKRLLSSERTLVGYDLQKELLLICDSSEYGLGAIIAHVMDDGSERPVMMASRTLQPHERRYGQIDKEALAIIFGVTKFHEFLAGRRFSIVTDHKPLVGLFNPAKPIPDQISPRMLRWSLKLSSYNYSIKYRPGKLIGNADALSRWTAPDTSSVQEEVLRDVLLLEEQPSGWELDASKIAAETNRDLVLQKVMFHVLHGWPRRNMDPSLQAYWTRREALSHNKGCLLWSNRVIIPTSLQDKVLKLLHDPHAGIVQTKTYARGYVWWVDMDRQIERVVANCQQCQLVRNNPPKDPQIWIVPEKPWSRVHVDFAGPFQGKTFLVLVDSYSKWFEAEIVPGMNSSTVIAVLRKIFSSQGLPEVLVSDNGRAFTSDEFNNFLKRNGIKHLYSPPYHPETNGQIERTIQTFKNKMKKLGNLDMQWQERLCKVLYYLRTLPNSSTNKTPAELLNGRRYRTAVSSLHPDSMPSRTEQQLEAAAQRTPTRTFTLLQPVLIRMYGPGNKWCRATVETVEGPTTYLVRTEDGELHRRHADQILARSQDTSDKGSPVIDSQPGNETDSELSQDPPIVIPPPELWPDVVGIPND